MHHETCYITTTYLYLHIRLSIYRHVVFIKLVTYIFLIAIKYINHRVEATCKCPDNQYSYHAIIKQRHQCVQAHQKWENMYYSCTRHARPRVILEEHCNHKIGPWYLRHYAPYGTNSPININIETLIYSVWFFPCLWRYMSYILAIIVSLKIIPQLISSVFPF